MNGVISPPTVYAEWVGLLDMLEQKIDDEDVRKALKQGEISWQPGVSERFSKKLIDTVNARLGAATDKFQMDFSRANGQEGLILQALLCLRTELSFLLDILDMPALPQKDRLHYCAHLRKYADVLQSSLEDSARTDRSGKMLVLFRNNKINEI